MKRHPTKYCLLTNDVETLSNWYNVCRPETGEQVLREGLPRLLDLYRAHDVKSTFFVTGTMARLFPAVVRRIADDGHEVGCHGLSHEVADGFDVMTAARQREHLRTARRIIEDAGGTDVVAFRAPALRVNRDTPGALADTGFLIDSSIASQRFDLFMSFGSKAKLPWLTAPRTPYRTDPYNLARRGDGPILEVPVSALLYPYIGTTLRIFPTATRFARHLLHEESRRTGKPIVFLTHPTEFIEENGGRVMVSRRSSNSAAHLLQGWLRGRLKGRNLGPVAYPLYEREIAFFKAQGYAFVTLREYCERELGFAAPTTADRPNFDAENRRHQSPSPVASSP